MAKGEGLELECEDCPFRLAMSGHILPLDCYDKAGEFPPETTFEEIFSLSNDPKRRTEFVCFTKLQSNRMFRSMSVGDLIYNTETKVYTACANVGWREVELPENASI